MNIKVIILLLSAIKQNFSSIAENSIKNECDSYSEKNNNVIIYLEHVK